MKIVPPIICLAAVLVLHQPIWAQRNSTAAPLAPRTQIFVLTGQSNSLGTTADKKEPDITPGQSPLDETIPFFWANRSGRSGAGADVLCDSSGGKILFLRAQGGDALNPSFWGPEIGFARYLAEHGHKNILIVKASRGGGGNSFWLKGSRDDHMYRHVVETVKGAVQVLPQGTNFEVAALLYVQGESDNSVEASAAGERLRTLAANLREDLPNAAGLRVIVGGIASAGATADTVRAQQSALPALDPTFRYVDTMDLQSQRYDNLHFSKGAKLELGRRMAKVWADWQ